MVDHGRGARDVFNDRCSADVFTVSVFTKDILCCLEDRDVGYAHRLILGQDAGPYRARIVRLGKAYELRRREMHRTAGASRRAQRLDRKIEEEIVVRDDRAPYGKIHVVGMEGLVGVPDEVLAGKHFLVVEPVRRRTVELIRA